MRHRHSTDDRTCPGWRCIYVSDTFCGWSQVWRAVHAFTWYVQLKTISKVSKNKKCNCIWDEYSLGVLSTSCCQLTNPSNPSQALESVFDIWPTHTEHWTLSILREIYSIHAICIWFLFGLINRTYTQITLPWSTCPIEADNVTVVECADSSETQYFWFRLKSSLFANLIFSFFYSQIFSFDCKLLGLLWMRRGALV